MNTGIPSKMLSPIPVLEDFQKRLHVGVFFKETEELAEKKTDGVIGKTKRGIPAGHNGTDKREIYQGGDEPGQASDNTSIRMNLDVPALVVILR